MKKVYNDKNELGTIVNNNMFPVCYAIHGLKNNDHLYDEVLINKILDGSIQDMSDLDMDKLLIERGYISQEDYNKYISDVFDDDDDIKTISFNIEAFKDASIVWLPKGTLYRRNSNDNQEWIEIFDINSYKTA